MSDAVVADTGPLIALSQLELLSVLPKLFDAVYVPDAVIREATSDSSKPGAGVISQAIASGLLQRKSANSGGALSYLMQVLGPGEAEALALAEDLNAIALVDERWARGIAQKRGIIVTGTLAVLVRAKKIGAVAAVEPLLDRLLQEGYWFSSSLIREVLEMSGES